jgi:hypothetical protein
MKRRTRVQSGVMKICGKGFTDECNYPARFAEVYTSNLTR